MKKENLLWLAVGAVAVYFLFFRKPAATATVTAPAQPTPSSTPTSTDTSSDNVPPEVKALTNEMLINTWKTWNCGIAPPFRKEKNYAAMMEEIKRRNLKPKCFA